MAHNEFISHPKAKIWIMEDDLERAAGRLGQLAETTTSEHNRTIFKYGNVALRMIQVFSYDNWEDYVDDYCLTCGVEHEEGLSDVVGA